MKKISIVFIAAILALTLVFTLTACGSKPAETKNDAPAATQAQETAAPAATEAAAPVISADDVVFTVNGASVALNTPISDVIAALGEASSVDSQLSCHGVGDDKTYHYDGFIVNSYPKDGVDYVLEVVVKNAGIPTSKGIQIGSTGDEVKAAYGEGFREIGAYWYFDAGEGKSLQFFMENGTVQEIDYYYNV
ncbi:MAG: hypothetical protein IJS27_04465 [Ruminococcus sp.]|nr:hypothetical protein [Ruminococcus sp.]